MIIVKEVRVEREDYQQYVLSNVPGKSGYTFTPYRTTIEGEWIYNDEANRFFIDIATKDIRNIEILGFNDRRLFYKEFNEFLTAKTTQKEISFYNKTRVGQVMEMYGMVETLVEVYPKHAVMIDIPFRYDWHLEKDCEHYFSVVYGNFEKELKEFGKKEIDKQKMRLLLKRGY